MEIQIVRGDITKQDVDAIVTAANEPLRGGGESTVPSIRAAGAELLRACHALAPCLTGSAVITPAFDLAPVKWVIHAVGPIYSGRPEDTELLMSAAPTSSARARAVAFPSISTGVYGYPDGLASILSVQALRVARTHVATVLLVAFSRRIAEKWDSALNGA